jgi:hypothetical protein
LVHDAIAYAPYARRATRLDEFAEIGLQFKSNKRFRTATRLDEFAGIGLQLKSNQRFRTATRLDEFAEIVLLAK